MRKINFFLSLCCMLLLGIMNANAYVGDSITGRATWTIAASSHCYEDVNGIGYISAAIDGNTRSYWHSSWGGTNASGATNPGNLAETPEYFIVDMGEVKSIGGVGYRPRTDNGTTMNGNGALKDYKIYISTEPFSTITTGATNDQKKAALELTDPMWEGTGLEWPNSKEKRWETTEAVQARYIMVVFLGSHGDPANKWANCSEFNVYTYAETAKKTLNEKLSEYESKLAEAYAALDDNNPGCYSNANISETMSLLGDAYTVQSNESATEDEVNTAIENTQNAIAAFQLNPLVSGYYKLVCAYDGYYTEQKVNKAIYTDGDKLVWGTVDDNDLAFYWAITVDGTNITVQNEFTKTYIGNWVSNYFPMSETAVNVTFNLLGGGQYNIITNSKMMHTGGHNNGKGVSGTIVQHSSGIGSASAWKLVWVESLPMAAALAEAKTAAQTLIRGIGATKIGTGLFYYSQTKIDALQALIDAATPATDEEIREAIIALGKTSDLDLMNMPEDGSKYYISNDSRNSQTRYLGIAYGGELRTYAQKSTRTVWQFNKVGDAYTIKNVFTGRYIKPDNTQYARWTGVTNAEELDLIPAYYGVYGATGIGIASQGNNRMHHDGNTDSHGNNKIVRWPNADASVWTLTAYAETDDATLATAEETLVANDRADALAAAPNDVAAYTTILGVSIAPTAEFFAEYDLPALLNKEYVSALISLVYAAAADNYYRITSGHHEFVVGTDTVFGALGVNNTANYGAVPAVVEPSSSKADQIWKIVAVEDGFKLYNVNEEAYLTPTGPFANSKVTAVTFTDFENGGKYYIDFTNVPTEPTGVFKLRDAADGVICVEGTNQATNNIGTLDHPLGRWDDAATKSRFTIAKATDIDITLAAALEGEAYATAYLPFDVTIPADVKAYVGDATYAAGDSYISMTEASAVAAENGFVLKGTTAGTATLTIGGTDAKTSAISGTLTQITTSDSYLVLGLVDNAVGFYKWSGATIAANKAFLNNTSGGAVKMLFGGDVTGIESVENGQIDNNAPLYDLSGRKVVAPQKGGIYIQGGKKIIVK